MGFLDTLLGLGGRIMNSGIVKKGIGYAQKGYDMYRGAKNTYKKYVPKQARTFIKSNVKGAIGGLADAYKRKHAPPPPPSYDDDDDYDDYEPPRKRYSPPPRRYSPPPRRSSSYSYDDDDDDDYDDYEPPSRYRRRY
jgi:hypothetical protein